MKLHYPMNAFRACYKKWFVPILSCFLSFAGLMSPSLAQDLEIPKRGPTLTILNTYDFNYDRLGLIPYSFAIRYDEINSSNSKKDIGRKEGYIYQFEFRYQSKRIELQEEFPTIAKNLLVGIGIGKNGLFLKTGRIWFNIDAFIGANYLWDRDIPTTSASSATRHQFLELSSMLDLNMLIGINKFSSVHLSFPVPLIDFRYEQLKNEDPNLPSIDQISTTSSIVPFDLDRKLVARFGFSFLLN